MRRANADIDAGLAALRGCIERLAPASVAVPALGCGNGGLAWPRVASMIRASLAGMDARILVHGPGVLARGGHAPAGPGRAIGPGFVRPGRCSRGPAGS